MNSTAGTPTAPQDVAVRKGGGQPGNSNALKTGYHTREARALRARITDLKRRVKQAITLAQDEIRRRKAGEL